MTKSSSTSSGGGGRVDTVKSLGASLTKEVFNSKDPCPDRCLDILQSLQKEIKQCSDDDDEETVASFKKSNTKDSLTKSLKSFRRHKRTSDDDVASSKWEQAIESTNSLLSILDKATTTATETMKKKKQQSNKRDEEQDEEGTLPPNTSIYRKRLLSQNKEIVKDPPSLPPPHVTIDSKSYPLPKRDAETQELTFEPGDSYSDKAIQLLQKFHPNRTPQEILCGGAFGGTYFRPITSAVTNRSYESSRVLSDTLHPDWIKDLDEDTMLCSTTYDKTVNKFEAKCGGSLGMWESYGWIADSDPYGWFQWYCRFYSGRRCSDDERQFGRWGKSAGPKGRFKSQLCNKILNRDDDVDEATINDTTISPVIRQVMWHWGLEITKSVLDAHRHRFDS